MSWVAPSCVSTSLSATCEAPSTSEAEAPLRLVNDPTTSTVFFVHQAAACRSDAANITFWEIDQSKLRGSEIWFVREQQIASLDRTHL